MHPARKVAIVTGGGSGIGRSASLALAHEGFAVVVAGRRREAIEATVRAGATSGAPMLAVPADVGEEADVQALFERTTVEFGRLDLLFNNAGIFSASVPLEEVTLAQWQQMVTVNLTGAFLCAREAFKVMKAQQPKGGRIINNGSIAAHAPRPHATAYTATKHAITGLTRSVSLDGRPHDIACGQIDIGNADTNIAHAMTQGILQANGSIAAEPTIDLEHVARAIVLMATLPLEANVQFMTVMATKMPFVGRG